MKEENSICNLESMRSMKNEVIPKNDKETITTTIGIDQKLQIKKNPQIKITNLNEARKNRLKDLNSLINCSINK